MLTKTVEVSEAQTRLKELLALVLEGTEIVLTEGSTPIARFADCLANYTACGGTTPWGNLD